MGDLDIATDLRSLTESKGGLKFDVVLSESPGKKTKIIPSPTKKDLSLSEIENKLEAAEQRRLSQLYKEQDRRSRRLNRIIEVQRNKHSFIKKFKTRVMESYDKKMRATVRNREAYLKSIQEKNRDLVLRVNEIRNTTLFLRESHFDSFCRKFEVVEQTRQNQFQMLEEHFFNLDMKMEMLQFQVEKLTDLLESYSKHFSQQETSMNGSTYEMEDLSDMVQNSHLT